MNISGTGIVVGAATALIVPALAEIFRTHIKHLRSLRAVRAEIRANLEGLKFDQAPPMDAESALWSVLIWNSENTRNGLGADIALWQETTARYVYKFYGSMNVLKQLIQRHSDEANRVLSIPGVYKPEKMLMVLKSDAARAIIGVITDAEDALAALDAEIKEVDCWASGS